ncbi:hypothetical protein CC86DRAFT_423406 [Ophiobolus disseminans]|uniref:Uncharacterized protein n=1 Tax=Ophiobolus disseminans TaxID=1469910 RepID=A0A6A6ZPJ1_9PLEO|nr:hypothetical protein CC86DRAFT_423406 [Ophiobolus disseminans]
MERQSAGQRRCLSYLLVQRGQHETALVNFVTAQGYQGDPAAANKNVRKYVRGSRSMYIASTRYAPLQNILDSAATPMAPFIAWNKVYSIFPYTTFIAKRCLLLRHIKDFASPQLRNWQDKGFDVSSCTVQDHLALLNPKDAVSSKMRIPGSHLVGDERSWIIPLSTHGLTPSPFPDYLIDLASFTVTSEALNSNRIRSYDLKTKLIKTASLKFQYFLENGEQERRFFKDRTVVGVHLLPPDRQPLNMNSLFLSNALLQISKQESNRKWTPSENAGWIYHDDDMLEMLKLRYPEFATKATEVAKKGTKRKRDDVMEK